jgi:hypothetical protein
MQMQSPRPDHRYSSELRERIRQLIFDFDSVGLLPQAVKSICHLIELAEAAEEDGLLSSCQGPEADRQN